MLLSSSVSRNGFSRPAVLGLKPGPVLLAPSRLVRRTLPVPTAVDPTAVHFGFWSAIGATSVAAATLYGLAAGMQAMLKDKGVDFSSSGLDLSNAPLDINPLLARLDIDITQIDLSQLSPAGAASAQQAGQPAAAATATAVAAGQVAEPVSAPVPQPVLEAAVPEPIVAVAAPEPVVAAARQEQPAAAAVEEAEQEEVVQPEPVVALAAEAEAAVVETAPQAAAVLDEQPASAPAAAAPAEAPAALLGGGAHDDAAEPAPAVVGGKMTVDAPAAAAIAGKMEVDAPAAAAIAGKVTVDAAAAAAVAGKVTADSAAAGQKEAAEAYETRLNKILKESTLAYQQTRRAQQQQPVSGAGLQQKVAALSKGYQEKVDTLWQSYERRRQQEAAKQLATEKVQLNMSEVEEASAAEAKKLNLWQRILAFFAALWAWFMRVLSQVFGGGKSSGTAGASA